MGDRKCDYCDRKESDGYEMRKNRKTGEILCSKHRTQIARHGEVLSRTRFDENEIIIHEDSAEVILYDRYGVENGRTIINLEDVDIVKKYKWSLKKKSKDSIYVRTTVNETDISLHRLLMGITNELSIVDHIDRDTMNNRKSNLRVTDSTGNSINKTIQSNNTSGVVGVYFSKSRNRWVARIKLNYKTTTIGYFLNFDDAVKARLTKEKELFKEFAPQKHLYERYGIID